VQVDPSEFRRSGSLLLKGLFEREEIEVVRRDAKQVFAAQLARHGLLPSADVSERDFEAALFRYFDQHEAEFINCGKQIQHLISLHRLSLDPRIMDVLSELGVESPNINTRPVLYFNSRHLAREEVYWRVFAHQDWRSMQGSLDGIVAWLPLIDTDVSLGAIEVIPESHKLGLRTTDVVSGFGQVDGFEDSEFVPIEVEQGDALFFSAFLVHRSGTNATDRIRWSCHFRYNNLAEPTFVQRGYPHSFIYKPTEELITPGFPSQEELRRCFP
jgi:phytanoyl-CoA hydroxylase